MRKVFNCHSTHRNRPSTGLAAIHPMSHCPAQAAFPPGSPAQMPVRRWIRRPPAVFVTEGQARRRSGKEPHQAPWLVRSRQALAGGSPPSTVATQAEGGARLPREGEAQPLPLVLGLLWPCSHGCTMVRQRAWGRTGRCRDRGRGGCRRWSSQ
jgi:hypothetical protein